MSIATEEQTVVDKVQKQLYIGGEWRDASGGGTLEVIDPATEEPLCEVADARPRRRRALDAAVDIRAYGRLIAQRPRGPRRLSIDDGARAGSRADDSRDVHALAGRSRVVYAGLLPLVLGEALRTRALQAVATGPHVLVINHPVGPPDDHPL